MMHNNTFLTLVEFLFVADTIKNVFGEYLVDFDTSEDKNLITTFNISYLHVCLNIDSLVKEVEYLILNSDFYAAFYKIKLKTDEGMCMGFPI